MADSPDQIELYLNNNLWIKEVKTIRNILWINRPKASNPSINILNWPRNFLNKDKD